MNFLQIFTESDGQVSSRRVGAIYSLIFASILSIAIILFKDITNWYIFIPVALFLTVSIVLWYFTSWAEIKELALTIKGKKE